MNRWHHYQGDYATEFGFPTTSLLSMVSGELLNNLPQCSGGRYSRQQQQSRHHPSGTLFPPKIWLGWVMASLLLCTFIL